MITLRLIPGDSRLVILGSDEGGTEINEQTGASVLEIRNADWNRDYSPWFAEKVFRKGEDFGGGADETLAAIEKWLQANGGDYEKTVIAGYSLAGLFALYAAASCDCFDGCVSASGSLWFPGFAQWLKENPVRCKTVYLSLGDQEKKARNPLMATVEEKTSEIFEMLKKTTDCEFQMNPGNHFNDPEGRLLKGIQSVLDRLGK